MLIFEQDFLAYVSNGVIILNLYPCRFPATYYLSLGARVWCAPTLKERCFTPIQRRSYSINFSVVPVKIYKNADHDKLQILKENQGKAGVYRLTNLINGKSYVGSSTNLAQRLIILAFFT